MKTIVIRTLGGKGTGYGHFYRCLSLAKALMITGKKIKVIFIINEELVDLINNTGINFVISNRISDDINVINNMDVSMFIFDSYLGNNQYLRNIKEKTKLMLIDDNNDIYDSSIPDIIYNGNIYAQDLGYDRFKKQIQLLGSKYLIMREEYWDNKNDENTERDMILVTTGGTDEYGITVEIINAIKSTDVKIGIIIGPGYQEDYIEVIKANMAANMELIYKPNSLKKYIDYSKHIITAGGSTVYEILSRKKHPVIYSIADNQDLICRTLSEMGVEYLGKYPNIDYSRVNLIIKRLFGSEDKENNIFNQITGKGVFLVSESILDILF